jgi:hypothetical protein
MTEKNDIQENLEERDSLLSSRDRATISHLAAMEPPHSQRAQALLAIDEGATQAEAGQKAELTKGQVRYWLGKFRKDGTSIFPEELLVEAQPAGEEEVQQIMPDVEETAGTVEQALAQQEVVGKAKKKSKKVRKSKKSKKTKKNKRKGKKSKKKSKKKGSKKAKGAKGKSGNKAKKRDRKGKK